MKFCLDFFFFFLLSCFFSVSRLVLFFRELYLLSLSFRARCENVKRQVVKATMYRALPQYAVAFISCSVLSCAVSRLNLAGITLALLSCQGRGDLLAYAAEQNIPVSSTPKVLFAPTTPGRLGLFPLVVSVLIASFHSAGIGGGGVSDEYGLMLCCAWTFV